MINRIKQVLEEADYVLEGRYWLLEQEGGGEDDDDDDDGGDEGDEGDGEEGDGEYDPPPWMTPTGGTSHAFHFPPWLMPPSNDPDTWPDHPMWDFYQDFLDLIYQAGNVVGGQGPFGNIFGPLTGWAAQQGVESILTFGQFISLLRFVLRPHMGRNRMKWLTDWLLELLGMSGSDEFNQLLTDMLRQWMMENLDYGMDAVCYFWPDACQPTRPPEEWKPKEGIYFYPGSLDHEFEDEGEEEVDEVDPHLDAIRAGGWSTIGM